MKFNFVPPSVDQKLNFLPQDWCMKGEGSSENWNLFHLSHTNPAGGNSDLVQWDFFSSNVHLWMRKVPVLRMRVAKRNRESKDRGKATHLSMNHLLVKTGCWCIVWVKRRTEKGRKEAEWKWLTEYGTRHDGQQGINPKRSGVKIKFVWNFSQFICF